jgi:O-antigen ligase
MFRAVSRLGVGRALSHRVPGISQFLPSSSTRLHSDYLQLLVETGFAGFSIMVWFLVVLFRRAAGKLENWTATASGALSAAALLGCVGILVHGFLDFNLQIPANAALFYVLCALAASAPLQESQKRRVVRRHNLVVQPTPEASAS